MLLHALNKSRPARNLIQKFRRNGNLELLRIFSMQFSFCVLISVGRSLPDSRLELLYVEPLSKIFALFLCMAVSVCVCAMRMHQPLPDLSSTSAPPHQAAQPFSYDFIYVLKSFSIPDPVVISFTLLFGLCAGCTAACHAYCIDT